MKLTPGLRAIAFAITLVGAAPAHAKDQFMSLRAQYNTAVAERGDAVQMALGTAEALLKSNPQDAVAQAYKGSLLTMVGGESLMPWNKLKYVNVGLDLMDGAVAAANGAPSHGLDPELEILMVAGFTNSRLPAMFKREPMARQAISRLIKHPAFTTLEPRLQAQSLAIAAAYAKRDGDAATAARLMEQATAADAATARRVFDERA